LKILMDKFFDYLWVLFDNKRKVAGNSHSFYYACLFKYVS
jgi:hypothetical protein